LISPNSSPPSGKRKHCQVRGLGSQCHHLICCLGTEEDGNRRVSVLLPSRASEKKACHAFKEDIIY